jgi:hypothetical protein
MYEDVSVHVYVNLYLSLRMYEPVSVHVYVPSCGIPEYCCEKDAARRLVKRHAFLFMYLYIYIYVCVCVCVCVCVYVYTAPIYCLSVFYICL